MGQVATRADAYRLLHQGALAMAQVEANGMAIDLAYLDQAITSVKSKIATLEKELMADEVYTVWKKRFGDKTKLGSRSQLADVFFKELGFAPQGMTATGRFAAGKSAMEKVDHPFARQYLRYEQWKKVLSTNLEGIRREQVHGYLHPFFHLHTVRSFRGSSSDINFQNLPNRDAELSEIVRRCFVPRRGNVLLEIDFKSAEVNISCCYHKDPTLIAYVKDSTKDMHRDTAMELFSLTREQVDKKTTRDWSKNRFVFPQFYGSVWFQCAPHLWEGVESGAALIDGKPLKEHLRERGIRGLGRCDPKLNPVPGTFAAQVAKIEKSFWQQRFPVYKQWRYDWYDAYKERGYFDLLTGFRVEGVYGRNDVTNYPVQGVAFHCLLWTLIRLQKWLRKHKMMSLIIGQIHDSIQVDAPKAEWREVASKVTSLVRDDLSKHWSFLNVPMSVETEMATDSWFSKKAVEL